MLSQKRPWCLLLPLLLLLVVAASPRISAWPLPYRRAKSNQHQTKTDVQEPIGFKYFRKWIKLRLPPSSSKRRILHINMAESGARGGGRMEFSEHVN
jgi:hypothetical protein